MFGAFAEAVRSTTQPCTLLLVAPVLAVVVAARFDWRALAAATLGLVGGGWVFIANWFVLDGLWLRGSAAVVVAVLLLLAVAPSRPGLGWAAGTGFRAAVGAGVGFVATLWWRPCVGTELGVILTAARRGLPGQMPGMAAYMLGAVAPVALIVLLVNTLAPRERALTVAAWVGATIGIVLAGALATGRHDDVVSTLTRLTTG